jgi:two-component system LytT family response regulator
VTLRALIVDDEPLARRRLRTLLRAEPQVEVIGEAEDGDAAVRAVRERSPDLLFLDVQMPGLDGFEVLETIGMEAASAPDVIFVTAYDQFALKAFDAHAVDYLLKPFDRVRLREAVKRAVKRAASDDLQVRLGALVADAIGNRPLRRLMVKDGGRIYFVTTDEIDWIEAAGHYLALHVGRQSHIVRETMTSLESRLDPARFVRIARGIIVRIDHIRELQPDFHGDLAVVLTSGARLRASRNYAVGLREKLSGAG